MSNLAAKRWIVRPGERARAEALAKEIGTSPVTAQLLLNRGIDSPEAAYAFLHPSLAGLNSPYLLKDMEAAVAAISKAASNHESMAIYGDYDVDGVSSTSVLLHTFAGLGIDHVQYYIPHRLDEGYGLNQEAIAELAEAGVKLIITVDCGVTAVDEALVAERLGVRLVITDHHQPGPELPRAAAVVNPHRPDCTYPFEGLAGVGVAFKLAQALLHTLGGRQPDWASIGMELLDLVALGTVADVSPMRGENRILVQHGLLQLERTESVGLKALLEVCGFSGRTLSAENLGFGLAPRINAMGRLGHAAEVVKLLTTDDAALAMAIAQELDTYNNNRKTVESELLAEAVALIEAEGYHENKVLVVANEGWHHGVIGIVASRLVERYYRPVVMIAIEDGIGKGSARSIEGFDLFGALTQCETVLEGYGGHTMAAGVSVREENIAAFRTQINKVADTMLTEDDLVPRLTVDAEVAIDDLSLEVVEELQRLAPFGQDNPEPIVVSRGLGLTSFRTVGKDLSHLSLEFSGPSSRIRGIAFGKGSLEAQLAGLDRIDVAFAPSVNEWRDTRSVQAVVRDLDTSYEDLRHNLLQRAAGAEEMDPVTAYDHGETRGELSSGTDELAAAAEELAELQAMDRPWVDARGCSKGDYLRKALSNLPLVLWVNRAKYGVVLANNIVRAFPALRGNIVVYSDSFCQRIRAEIEEEHLRRPWQVVVTDSVKLPAAMMSHRTDLVVYQVPPDQLFLRTLASALQSTGGLVHLLYDDQDISEARKFVAASLPDADKLRQLYIHLNEMVSREGTLKVKDSAADLIRSCGLTRRGIETAIEILTELGLCRYEAGIVSMRPSPQKKLDLNSSVRYNSIVRLRETANSWLDEALRTDSEQLTNEALMRIR